MLKILTNSQIREIDRLTIELEGISSLQLMERTASKCQNWLTKKFGKKRKYLILAGTGNNGGDGLVIARLLAKTGAEVSACLIRNGASFSPDFKANLDRLIASGIEVVEVSEIENFPAIPSETVVIDALLGLGLNRNVEGLFASCIGMINASNAEVIAIDVPSGLFTDKPMPEYGIAIQATYTLTFQAPKLAFILPDNESFVGQLVIIDIGLSQGAIDQMDSPFYYLDEVAQFKKRFSRGKFDHKGQHGHALISAGSVDKMGAAVLAASTALRSGCGLVTMHVPYNGILTLNMTNPEAMLRPDKDKLKLTEMPNLTGFSAIGVGPGIGTDKATRKFLMSLLKNSEIPLVIDADAINILSNKKSLKKLITKNSILTPHLGEFERLFGKSKNTFERLNLLRKSSQNLGIFILLKGAHSALCTPSGKIYFNSTGNSGMAKGGSGDVLTGLITGLLADSKDPFVAALCGMYIHGLSGDYAAQAFGIQSMKAMDIVDNLGHAINSAFSR